MDNLSACKKSTASVINHDVSTPEKSGINFGLLGMTIGVRVLVTPRAEVGVRIKIQMSVSHSNPQNPNQNSSWSQSPNLTRSRIWSIEASPKGSSIWCPMVNGTIQAYLNHSVHCETYVTLRYVMSGRSIRLRLLKNQNWNFSQETSKKIWKSKISCGVQWS